MSQSSPLVTKRNLGLAGIAAFGACVACCTIPLLATAGIGGSALSLVAGYIRPGADLAVAGLVGVGVLGVLSARRLAKKELAASEGCTDGGCGCASGAQTSIFSTPTPRADEPIVCTADLSDKPTVQGQLDGYRAAFAHLLRTERFAGGVRWVFAKRDGLDVELRMLAENEHRCCKFFKFDLRQTESEIIWEITACEGASSILGELAQLPERLRQHARGPDMAAIKQTVASAGLVFAADERS